MMLYDHYSLNSFYKTDLSGGEYPLRYDLRHNRNFKYIKKYFT